MKHHVFAVFGYIAATFVTQATSHFLLFKDHYAAVSYMKSEPDFALGIVSMIIQGIVISFIYTNSRFIGNTIFDAVTLAWLFGAFLVSYVGLAEASKYSVPNVLSWIGVEFLAGAVQFTLAGIFLWLAHRVK